MVIRKVASGTSSLGGRWLCHYQHHCDHSINRWHHASMPQFPQACFTTLQNAVLVPLVWLEKNGYNG